MQTTVIEAIRLKVGDIIELDLFFIGTVCYVFVNTAIEEVFIRFETGKIKKRICKRRFKFKEPVMVQYPRNV